jgi:hypothetical protein
VKTRDSAGAARRTVRSIDELRVEKGGGESGRLITGTKRVLQRTGDPLQHLERQRQAGAGRTAIWEE